MKRFLVLAACLAMTTLLPAAVQSAEAIDSIWGEGLDADTMVALLERGQLFLIERDEWTTSYRNCAELINAPADKVWDVVTNFAQYYRFLPEMAASRVQPEKDGLIPVDYTIRVVIVAGLSVTVEYTWRYRLKKPFVEIYHEEGGEMAGEMQVIPIDGGRRSLFFFRDKASDVREISPFLAMIMDRKPDVEVALQVMPITVYLTAVKKQAEALHGPR